MRWHHLNDMRMLWDHAYPIAQAQRLLSEGAWPALGQVTTFFFNNPPGQAYLSLIPILLFGSWWCTVWFFTTLNVLAVPLLYRLGRDLFDERVALIGSFLLAVSPWVTYFSRATWSGAITPISTALILTLLLPALSGLPRFRRGWRMFGALVVLTVFSQSYLLALIIVPVQIGGLILLRVRRLPWRAVLAGGLVFAVATGVFTLNLARDWPNQTDRLTRFFLAAEGPLTLRHDALYLAEIYVTGLDFRTQPLPPTTVPPILLTLVRVTAYGLAGALALGVVLGLKNIWQRKRDAWISAALMIWWLTPVALLTLTHRGLYPWHALATIPAGQLLAAGGLRWLWGERRWLSPLVLAGGAILAGVSFANLQIDNVFNASHPISATDTTEAFDRITLQATLQVGQMTRRLVDTYQIKDVFARLPEPDLAAWSQRPVHTISWFNTPNLLILPQDHASLYVRLQAGTPPPLLKLSERVAVIQIPPNNYVAFDIFPKMDWAAMRSLPQIRLDWPSDTGRTFLGYTLAGDWRAGRTGTVTTYWLIETLPDNYTQFLYGPYLHLNTANGATLVNSTARGIEGYYYRRGDLYIQPIAVPIPGDARPGQYQLELGLYDGVHQAGTTFFPANEAPRRFYTTTVAIDP